MPQIRRGRVDRMLRPVHRWIWGDSERRVRKLLAFAEVEADGGRDILRASEVTPDPLLRRLYLAHAIDELRHADLFRERGAALLQARPARATPLSAGWLPSGDHGIDDLRVEDEPDESLPRPPPFAWFAKRAERRESPGWMPIPRDRDRSPTSQY